MRHPAINIATVAFVVVVVLASHAATAGAVPTLGAPSAETLAQSRPLFTWTVEPGESVETLEVSRAANVTPEGEFFDDDRVAYGLVTGGATSWQATSRMPAGSYWWNLGYTVEQPVYTSSYTAPAAFTVPVQIRAGGVSIAQWIYSLDTVTVAYISNTKRVDVKCLVYLGSRVVARGGKTDTYVNTGIRDSSSCEVNVGHAYAGKRLRLVGEVRAGGRLVRASRYFYGKRG